MQKTKERTSHRIHNSLLTPLERPLLQWMVACIPNRVSPDHLTLLGLLGMAAAGAGYALAGENGWWLHFVNLMIVLNWLGDSLDGNLARFRNRQRPRYGYYVDHLLDAIGTLLLVAGLCLSPFMTSTVGLSLLVCYFLLAISSYLATCSLGVFRLSFFRFGPTELRLLLMVGNLFLLTKPWVTIGGWKVRLFDAGAAVAGIAMLLVLAVSAFQTVRQLKVLEPA